MHKEPKVAILVLNFNGKRLLKSCLASVETTLYPNYEVYLVDNRSSDGSASYVSQHFPFVKIISFDENKGFCGAYNEASRLVDADYLLFLNNDITIKNPDWLDNMVRIISGDATVGAVGAKLLIASKPELIENVGGAIYGWQGGTRIGFGEMDRGQYDDPPVDVFYASGAALLVKREVFLEAGGFDSEMFAYSEDFDLCWRLRLMGYEVIYCPQAVLLHAWSASWKRSKTSLYLTHRNLLRAYLKNYAASTLVKQILPILVINFAFALSAAGLTRDFDFLFMTIKSVGHNMVHLKSTLRARKVVQNKRRLDDKTILALAGKQKIERISTLTKRLKALA